MILNSLFAFLGGAASNQLDGAFKLFEDDWQLVVRYVTGTLMIFLFFVTGMKHLREDATKDGALAFASSAFGVGGGVFIARCLKDLVENRAK